MRNLSLEVTIAAVLISVSSIGAHSFDFPTWAFATDPPSAKSAPALSREEEERDVLAKLAAFMRPMDDGTQKHLPASSVAFTMTQIRDLFTAPDWYPDEHPLMPKPVSHGRKPSAFACGYCHLPHGQGKPENSSLAGLPADYIVQQVKDIRSGVRKSSAEHFLPQVSMRITAVSATDEEVAVAADYFSKLKLVPWIRVVETEMVPKTRFGGFILLPVEPMQTEPIGNRIIEVPEDVLRTELRDPKSGFVAYVPVGSIAKGEALVTTGGSGKTIPCGICHGSDLKGTGPQKQAPSIAARSPSYITRQLYDFQHGTRAGIWSPMMKDVVAKLSQEDIVSIVAYLTSRTP